MLHCPIFIGSKRLQLFDKVMCQSRSMMADIISSMPEFIAAVATKHIIFTLGYLNRFKHLQSIFEKRFKES
jgi:hypothetical protein